jgi:hypothetical protein
MGSHMERILASPSPPEAAASDLEAVVRELDGDAAEYPLFQLCEVIRLAFLPWVIGGITQPGTEDGVTLAELLVLLAASRESDGTRIPAPDLNLFAEAKKWKTHAREIVDLAQIEQLLKLGSQEATSELDRIALSMRGNEVWIRNPSYPDMVAATLRELFGPVFAATAIRELLGFDAEDAMLVLDTCHEIQVKKWNQRLSRSFENIQSLHDDGISPDNVSPDDPRLAEFREAWLNAWQGQSAEVAVQPSEIADQSGLDPALVGAVANFFMLDVRGSDPVEVVKGFTAGDNPLRTNPLLVAHDGSMMLLHNSFNATAVRENIEQALKGGAVWEQYQHHRGEVLERLTGEAFDRLMPGADKYAAFDYFVPADESELAGPPSGYTKKVEGDLLLVQDDVAVVVEAKAVAVNPRSRSGDTRKLRRDLTGIITKASEQASRLADRIEQDKGVRLHPERWVNLSRVREIHILAVSLEDLVSVATATADLITAGLISDNRIPWTVSIHDLQIISELMSTPAEFLLYLQRRCDPEVTQVYHAPDELDLFLYYYESGLYVPPDPDRVEEEFPFMKATTSARRQRRGVRKSLITSRTDALDRWHYSRIESPSDPLPKPELGGSPMLDMAKSLEVRRDYGWLSIGAALLSGSTKAQMDMSKQAGELLSNPDPSGRERSMTMPIGSNRTNAWLLVWATRPLGRDASELEEHIRGYLRAKKYQLGLPRGAAFIFDEGSRSLSAVLYDGDELTPSADLDEQTSRLIPADRMPHRLPPRAKRR